MKTFILCLLVLLSSQSFGQMQKGDQSLGVQGFIFAQENSGNGFIQANYSYNFTDNLLSEFGPNISISASSSGTSSGGTSTKTKASLGINTGLKYYFNPQSKTIYGLIAGYYIPDLETTGNSAIKGGATMRAYFNQNIFLNVETSLGFTNSKGSKSTTSFIGIFGLGYQF